VSVPALPRVKQSVDVVLYLSPLYPDVPDVPDVPFTPDVPLEPLVPLDPKGTLASVPAPVIY
jgi:hypothetical protein